MNDVSLARKSSGHVLKTHENEDEFGIPSNRNIFNSMKDGNLEGEELFDHPELGDEFKS